MAVFCVGGVIFVMTGDVSVVQRGALLGLLVVFAILLVVGLRTQAPQWGVHFIISLHFVILIAGAIMLPEFNILIVVIDILKRL